MDYMPIYILLIFLIVSSLSSRIRTLEKKMSLMNLTLDKIAKQVGVPEPSFDDDIRILISQGKKIPAIKKVREAKGLGLKEAKEYVDSFKI
ncbi:ribosomal protein L7/L12 [Clostridium lacusfryxellense]|uniref:ribosomal protein L7/L12 n=1 Tax=Clostridium lacusfryxellense TaxID=205328 RepID=UPI001C0B61C0|nr:ribosomal protein L7/L12 [Clostridium lacusfryxellense]MBU3110217.1 ribosomal protein L7/L12 [Clostridium lacusfryxellense]